MREGQKKKERKKKKNKNKEPSITNFLHSHWFQEEKGKKKKKKSWVRSQFSKSMTYVEFEQRGGHSCLKKHPNPGQEATGLRAHSHRQPVLLW